MTVTIHQGDALEVLRTMPAQSVHMCVTSPPYYGLRDYGVAGQIGLEETLDEYIAKLVAVFAELRRVLRDDGTLWANMGDSYAGNGGQSPQMGALFKGRARQRENVCLSLRGAADGVKPKDLMGVPWLLAFALRADGWFLRQDIIWAKPNPMPESVTDRCTKSHEYLFLLSKSPRYYFDANAIAEPIAASSAARLAQPNIENQAGSMRVPGKTNGAMKAVGGEDGLRNKRSVWTVATQPFREAHFATFPPALIDPCIRAGTSEIGACSVCGSHWIKKPTATNPGRVGPTCRHRRQASKPVACVVLDPFGGSGTTGIVADRLQRSATLIELNPDYVAMARRRVHDDVPPLLREGGA